MKLYTYFPVSAFCLAAFLFSGNTSLSQTSPSQPDNVTPEDLPNYIGGFRIGQSWPPGNLSQPGSTSSTNGDIATTNPSEDGSYSIAGEFFVPMLPVADQDPDEIRMVPGPEEGEEEEEGEEGEDGGVPPPQVKTKGGGSFPQIPGLPDPPGGGGGNSTSHDGYDQDCGSGPSAPPTAQPGGPYQKHTFDHTFSPAPPFSAPSPNPPSLQLHSPEGKLRRLIPLDCGRDGPGGGDPPKKTGGGPTNPTGGPGPDDPDDYDDDDDDYPEEDEDPYDDYEEKCNKCTYSDATHVIQSNPGQDEGCSAGGSSHQSTSSNRVDSSYNGGSSANGRGGAEMTHRSNDLTSPTSANPSNLQFHATGSAQVTLQSGGTYPSQIVTEAGTTTVTPVGDGYDIRFYRTGQNPQTDPPQSHTRVRYWQSGNSYSLRFIQTLHGGSIVEHRYTQVVDGNAPHGDRWILFEGAELQSVSDFPGPNSFLRRTVIDLDDTDRSERIKVSEKRADNGNWQVVSDVENTFGNFCWGSPLIKRVIDPDGKKLTRRWTYWSATEANRFRGGALKSFMDYTGEKTEYDYSTRTGLITEIKSSHGNEASATRNVYTYGPNYVRKGVKYIGDTAVSQYYVTAADTDSLYVRSFVRSPFPDAPKDAPGSLITTVEKYRTATSTNGITPEQSNKIKSITYPNGTRKTWTYSKNSQGHVVVSCKMGSPNLDTGKEIIKTYDHLGNRIRVEEKTLDAGGQPNTPLTIRVVTRDNLDGLGRPLRTTVSFPGSTYADQVSTRLIGCCGIKETTNFQGVTTKYHYDHLKRLETVESLGVVSGTQYNGLARRRLAIPAAVAPKDSHDHYTVREVTLPSDHIVQSEILLNLAEEIVRSSTASPQHDDGISLVDTLYSYSYGMGMTVTTTEPDTGVSIVSYAKDGSLLSTSGSAVNPMSYEYGTDLEGVSYENGAVYARKTTQANGTQWSAQLYNFLGQYVGSTFAHGGKTSRHFNSLGQLVRRVDPDGITTLYQYGSEGELTHTALDLNNNNQIDLAVDRITWSDTVYTTRASGDVVSEAVTKFFDDGDTSLGNAFTVSRTHRSADGLKVWHTPQDNAALLVTQTTTLQGSGTWYSETIYPSGLYRYTFYQNGLLYWQPDWSPDLAEIPRQTTYFRDNYNRIRTAVDGRTGTTAYAYNNSGDIKTHTLERANGTADDLVTTYTYDEMGRTISMDEPDTLAADNVTHVSYDLRGLAKAVWGDQTYPRYYQYDAQGRMSEMRTYQDLAHDTQPLESTSGYAQTTWQYDSVSGWLVGKRDHENKGADYTYTLGGRLESRTWARTHPGQSARVHTSYDYHDETGQLVDVTYTHDADLTPDLTYTYDRLGRLDTVERNGNLHADYDYSTSSLRLTHEHFNQDTAIPKTLQRHYDSLLRQKSVVIPGAYTSGYGYDAAGRLNRIWHQPALDPNNDPQGSADFTYNYLSNSSLVENVVGPVHTVDNIYFPYRNILDVKINRHSVDPTTYSTYDYNVNELGQRIQVAHSGTAFSAPHTIDWSYNERGELVEADHSGDSTQDRAYEFDAIGNRKKTAEALLPSLPSADNYTANTLNQYTATPGAITPNHDDDGNQLKATVPGSAAAAIGHTTSATDMTWDAENRLVSLKVDGVTINYGYDYLGRRISRIRSGNPYLFHYDGWNRLTFYNYSTLNRRYTWGKDLSGSMRGVGGVGGLLATEFLVGGSAPNRTSHYPLYDGNGNITQYLRSDGIISAQFEYDPFGRITKKTGPIHQWFRYQFSTKFRGYYTGLYDYGYRWYNPVDGRWISRDPIKEEGGLNLYGMVYNDPIGWIDFLGQYPVYHHEINYNMGRELGIPASVLNSKDFGVIIDHTIHNKYGYKWDNVVIAALKEAKCNGIDITDEDVLWDIIVEISRDFEYDFWDYDKNGNLLNGAPDDYDKYNPKGAKHKEKNWKKNREKAKKRLSKLGKLGKLLGRIPALGALLGAASEASEGGDSTDVSLAAVAGATGADIAGDVIEEIAEPAINAIEGHNQAIQEAMDFANNPHGE